MARVVGACLFLLLAACAPRVDGLGPTNRVPVFQDDAFIMADGYALPVDVIWPDGTPRAAIVALHGFNDYANAFRNPAQAWAEAGFVVYAYDQRGFGRTVGRGVWHGADAMVSDLIAVTRLVRDRHPGLPLVVVGESMGAAVVLASFEDGSVTDLAADRIILSAPAVWGWQVMPWWQRAPLQVLAHTLPWLEVAPRVRRTPSDNIDMLRALGRDPLMIRRTRIDAVHGLVTLMDRAFDGIPALGDDVLILYGVNEDIIPGSITDRALARLTPEAGWRLAIYDTGFHMLMRDLNADRVLADITAFIEDADAPLPSGREVEE